MSNARQVDLLLGGITGDDGSPLSGGKVYCYNSGSSQLKSLFDDVNLYNQSTNPVILDANGKALKYALGDYKFVIKDANDATLYTYDNLSYGYNPSSISQDYLGSIWVNTVGGTSSAIEISTGLTTPLTTLTAGARFVFSMPFDCAATPTLKVDSCSPVEIMGRGSDMHAGDLGQSMIYEFAYDGTYFYATSTSAVVIDNYLGGGAVTTVKIADGAVTTDKLASSAVTGGKIATSTVTGSNIASATITADNIASSTITGSNIASSTITNTNIATGTITYSRIADGTITYDKLDNHCLSYYLKQTITSTGTYSITLQTRNVVVTPTSGSVTLSFVNDFPLGEVVTITRTSNASITCVIDNYTFTMNDYHVRGFIRKSYGQILFVYEVA